MSILKLTVEANKLLKKHRQKVPGTFPQRFISNLFIQYINSITYGDPNISG